LAVKRKLLNIVVDTRPDVGRRIVRVGDSEYEVFDYLIGGGSTWALLCRTFFLPLFFSRFDAILTSEHFSSFAVNLRLLTTLSRIRHVTVGLNQSRKLLRTGFAPIDAALNWIFRRGDLYIMHSRKELTLFNRLHGLALGRLVFSHWGFDRPSVGDDVFHNWPKPYVSLVGRNNRDVELFCRACNLASYDGIIVCSSRQRLPEGLPSNVHVFRDLDMHGAMSCIRHSRANLILVNDSERGAGHITAVAGMELDTPQIASDVDVLSDYFIDGYNCIQVPVGDVEAVRRALDAIINNPEFAKRLAMNGRHYAARWLTHEAATGRVFLAIDRMFSGKVQQAVDPEWTEFVSGLPGSHSHG
jgi:hypothetical protein